MGEAARAAASTVALLDLGMDVRALDAVRSRFRDRAGMEIDAPDAKTYAGEVTSLPKVEAGERVLACPTVESDDQDRRTPPGIADIPQCRRGAEEVHRTPRVTLEPCS
jgi:hypothetical protein